MDRLEYHRPRGAQGNYKAILKLQYISSETIEVICYVNYGGYGDYNKIPVNPIIEGEIIMFDLPPLKIGDCILIRIRDKDVALPQINYYKIERKGIRLDKTYDYSKLAQYQHDRWTLSSEEQKHWESIRKTEFKPIELVDLDGKSKWPKLF